MVFSSPVFLFIFLPIILLLYFNPLLKTRGWRNVVLLLASLAFYTWGEPVFIFLVLLTVLWNWFAGRQIDKGNRRRLWLCLALGADIALLGIFKYLGFITENLSLLAGRDLAVHIGLPIGISFFSFQMMSYVLDVYNGKSKAQKSVWKVLLYILMFPQLIAGPIVRYQTVEHEIDNRIETREGFTQGMTRFVYGLGKKLLLADMLAAIADQVFHAPGEASVATLWLGAFCYTFQIYYDFSGYSDMAIGLGRMMGFHFPENFDYPYIAASVTDFWRRWHISLTTWFRDYVYIPLGGNRVPRLKWIRNLFVVWLLTGIWHGANWTFIVWGLLYFCILLAEKTLLPAVRSKWSIGPLSHIYTFVVVTVCWVIFRSDTVADAGVFIRAMFGLGGAAVADEVFFQLLSAGKVFLVLAALLCWPVYPKIKARLKPAGQDWMDALLTCGVFALCVMTCVSSSYSPFIYFNF